MKWRSSGFDRRKGLQVYSWKRSESERRSDKSSANEPGTSDIRVEKERGGERISQAPVRNQDRPRLQRSETEIGRRKRDQDRLQNGWEEVYISRRGRLIRKGLAGPGKKGSRRVDPDKRGEELRRQKDFSSRGEQGTLGELRSTGSTPC